MLTVTCLQLPQTPHTGLYFEPSDERRLLKERGYSFFRGVEVAAVQMPVRSLLQVLRFLTTSLPEAAGDT